MKSFAASRAATRPLRAAPPTLTLLAMVPRASTRPEDCTAAVPSAWSIRSGPIPSIAPTPAAAPNTPQVEVMCQPWV